MSLFDPTTFVSSLVAIVVADIPVGLTIIWLVRRLRAETQRLNALAEMAPDTSASDRAEMKAYAEEQVKDIADRRRGERAGRVYFLEGKP